MLQDILELINIAAICVTLIYMGILLEKLEDKWHDRHFHRRRYKK